MQTIAGSTPFAPARNTAVDAYRGFAMLLMMAEVLRLPGVARAFQGNWFWEFLAFNQSHVEWAGCSLHEWFLNLFQRSKPFVFNGGGYLTLSFIPTLGTMILGLIAGRWLRAEAPRVPFKKLLIAAAAGFAASILLHYAGICPIVKRIWTPAWTLFSGGICFLFLAGFCWVIEVRQYRKWAFPLIVIGMNSIAAYFLADYFGRQIADAFRIHLGAAPFQVFGTGLEPLTRGALQLLTYWMILFWMYRRKIFLRI